MIINPIKTEKITAGSHTLIDILDKNIPHLSDGSILVVTSKIVSLTEGRVVKKSDATKDDLIKTEAQRYMPSHHSPIGVTLTITHNLLVPSAGIDESNGNGYYILWPENPHESAKRIRSYLVTRFSIQNVGVLITDSRTTPMRWGTSGVALSYAGFAGLNDFIGSPDLFGRPMEMTKVNVADGLAAAAVVTMGESNEQTPLAVIRDVPFVHFDADKPTEDELEEWQIPMEIDVYGPILSRGPWEKGQKG